MSSMQPHWARFSDLDVNQLYEILRLRQSVFIIEQKCIYPDIDLKDLAAFHLSFWNRDVSPPILGAYLRVHPPGTKFPEPCIGRVITAPEVRGTGLGKTLMKEALKRIEQTYGNLGVRISAQKYLEKFYRGLGFETVGESYLEDDIPHIEMFRK